MAGSVWPLVYLLCINFALSFSPTARGNSSISERYAPDGHWPEESESYRNGTKKTQFLVSIKTDNAKCAVDSRFVSIGLAVRHVVKRNFPYESEEVLTLASGLAPAILRVGGRSADETVFVPKEDRFNANSIPRYRSRDGMPIDQVLTGTTWKKLNEFCIQIGFDLLFDFNLVLLSDGDGWDPTNAKMLLDYNSKLGYDVMWQLGNEPNLFHKNYDIFMSGREIGKAYNELRRVLTEHRYRQNFLVGPDTTHLPIPAPENATANIVAMMDPYHRDEITNLTAYLESFLREAGRAINVTSIHFYNILKGNGSPDDYTDPYTLDRAAFELEQLDNVLREAMPAGSRTRWLTETSECTSGGLQGSSRYVAGFILMSNLGTAAVMDVSVFVYWNLISDAHYALLTMEHHKPKPMYWVLYLHKRLVGRRVLSVQPLVALDTVAKHRLGGENATRYVRVFAHCTKESTSYPAGAVTIMAINMLNDSHASLQLTQSLAGKAVDEYHLTPHGGLLNSTHIDLNGEKLSMIDNTTFPYISPRHLPPGSTITLSPMTYGYYVIPDACAPACVGEDLDKKWGPPK